jgi:hypothetical protein
VASDLLISRVAPVDAAALGPRFRLYSVVSLVILGLCGGLTFLEAPQVGLDGPTPWIGVWERINVGVFLLWVIVLAIAVWPGVPHAMDRRALS